MQKLDEAAAAMPRREKSSLITISSIARLSAVAIARPLRRYPLEAHLCAIPSYDRQ